MSDDPRTETAEGLEDTGSAGLEVDAQDGVEAGGSAEDPPLADETGDAGEDGGGGAAGPHGDGEIAGPEPREADEPNPLEEELTELNERHLRLVAEFSNYRRRQEAERLQTWGRAQAELIGQLLDVLDDLQRVSALEIEDEAVTIESIVEGIDLVERKFVRTLEEVGVETVSPDEGDPFDPETMEAMMRVPTEDPELDDAVAQVVQIGYRFRETLVRPARVSVYKS